MKTFGWPGSSEVGFTTSRIKAAQALALFYRGKALTADGVLAAFSGYMDMVHENATWNESARRTLEKYEAFERDPSNMTLQNYFAGVHWLGYWGALACPMLRVDAKWAASIMATTVPKEFYDLVEPPWGAFVVSIPDELGLVAAFHDREEAIETIEVGRFEGRRSRIGSKLVTPEDVETGEADRWTFWHVQITSRRADGDGNHATKTLRLRLDDLCGNHASDIPGDSTSFKRTSNMIGPLIGGICMASRAGLIQRVSAKAKRAAIERGTRAPGECEYVIRAPVTVDLRKHVREYIAGHGGKQGGLTVQSLVRGHWKQQACGAMQRERKLIHVEPYWRGPDDAPIALRQHILKGHVVDSVE